ncbi:MAG: yqgF [Gammaproteobacteria bacterium]|jgi:putative Holliday junction resolvase|nr:yqgF [Gammaproteobacteria bacterium]
MDFIKTHVILGFDVGSHKIGVAVGQTLTQQAKPLPRIIAQKGLPTTTEIKKLLNEWRPDVIVVGLPTMMDGKKQFTTDLALAFIEFLKTLTDLPVFSVDERLTTKAARSDLFEQGGYRHLQKADVDSYAAKLIVESWMHSDYSAAKLV